MSIEKQSLEAFERCYAIHGDMHGNSMYEILKSYFIFGHAKALEHGKGESGWQPIETAPKDGTRVMLFQEGKVYFGFWLKESNIGPCWLDGAFPIYRPTHWTHFPPNPTKD